MRMSPAELKQFGSEKFQKQSRVLSLWQTIADHFYPERAQFTRDHVEGSELGISLASSQPVLIRRELGNSIGAMLRDGDDWFKVAVEGDTPDHMGKKWLEYATKRQYQYMHNRAANLRRTVTQGDHDWAAFGQTVISVEPNKKLTGLLFRNWHLRDCAWWDDDEENVGGLVRKWNPTVREIQTYFNQAGDTIPKHVNEKITKARWFDEIQVQHFEMPSEMYGHDEFNQFKYVSVFLDLKGETVIRAVGKNYKTYIVPRFQTISGSPYAYSPATVVGLPEARTLQSMTHTLLEAGERMSRPPMAAYEKAIRGDANLFSDGITYISESFDSRGNARQPLWPLNTNIGGFPYGMDLREGVIEVLQTAFYVNKINLPETTHEMTAYEVQERMKQYRRENLPLFTPVEHDYNGQLCETAFNVMMEFGMLGSHMDIPRSLRSRDVIFKFQSPLSESDEERKGATFSMVSKALAEAADFDDTAALNVDFDTAIRDAVSGVGAPEKWLRDVKEVEQRRDLIMQQRAAAVQAEQQVSNG